MRYVIATLLFCLAGIFSLPLSAQTSTSADSTSVTGHDIVKVAMKYIGVPYRSGRMNPKVGFDCSGFTTYVFKKENIQLTRSSRSQFTEGVEVSSRCEPVYRHFLFHSCQPYRYPHLFFR